MNKAKLNLVTSKLGLKLNEQLKKLLFSRIEYGYVDDLSISFEIETIMGGSKVVTEEEFATSKKRRTVGIFGSEDPISVLDALLKRYPDATILMRKDPPARRRKKK